jgi:hypothetical protein
MTAPRELYVRARRAALLLVLAAAAGCSAAHAVERPTDELHPEPSRGQLRRDLNSLTMRVADLRASWGFDAPPPAALLGAPPRSARCTTMAAAAEEICHASSRICGLAEALDEADAHRVCRASREDCVRARLHAERCR